MEYPPYQDPMLPANPTQEELVDFQTPISEMPIEQSLPQKPSKGLSFDFNGLVQQLEKNGFDSLSEAQKNLLWDMKDEKIQYSPEQMALYVQNFNERQRERNSPQAQAQLQSAQNSAKLTGLKVQQTEGELAKNRVERRDVMLSAQSMLDASSRINEAVNNNLVGPWKDVEQKFDGSGLPFSDPDEYAKRKALEVQTKKSVIDAVTAFKGPLSDSDRKFFIEMFPTINEPVGVWKDYADQLRTKFKPITDGNFETPNNSPAAPQQAAPQPAAAPVKMIGNRKFVLQPNGKYVESR